MTLETFKEDVKTLENVIETNFVTENGIEYVQVTWPHNPANDSTQLHNILKQYDEIVQVVPSDTLREHNPDEAEFTQYYTTR